MGYEVQATEWKASPTREMLRADKRVPRWQITGALPAGMTLAITEGAREMPWRGILVTRTGLEDPGSWRGAFARLSELRQYEALYPYH